VRPTVLIVDDHATFRASARALLEAEGFDVVGEAADGAGAVEAVAVLRPEIVLLDIQLPDLDGMVVAEQLAGAEDSPVVVLISSRDAAPDGGAGVHS
jgi:DNA-binding NarL/FixJ family response regulator